MPKGIPVATVAIGNAENAGLLAVRIVGCSRPALLKRMAEYQEGLCEAVNKKSRKLVDMGAQGTNAYCRVRVADEQH